MKKIVFTLSLIVIAGVMSAQDVTKAADSAKKQTPEAVISTNGAKMTFETMVVDYDQMLKAVISNE
jgi:hypothetical protein